MSNYIAIKADVRQGGALSPCPLAIFIDDIVIQFQTLLRSCNSEFIRTNIFQYVGDIVFLSVSTLHAMLYLCESEPLAPDMCIGIKNLYARDSSLVFKKKKKKLFYTSRSDIGIGQRLSSSRRIFFKRSHF